MDQLELEANACNRCQARENACERGTIDFGFASRDRFSLVEKVARILLTNHRA